MHNYGYGSQPMMGYWNFGDFIGQVILIVVLVCIVIWALRMIFGSRRGRWGGMGMMGGPGMWRHQSALSILSERFAKGEISKEEYEEKKKVLME